MGLIKTPAEQEIMRTAGKLLAEVLANLEKQIQAGITPQELDKLAEKHILELGAKPSFKGYSGYPATLCTSVNEEVVHSIPKAIPLKEGDIISVDCGLIYKGFHSDSAFTKIVSPAPSHLSKFLETAERALEKGIAACKPNNFISDIGLAVQNEVEKSGYSIIKELTGHGIGNNLHEDPHVPNYAEKQKGLRLKPGMTLAIEPIISMGKSDIFTTNDNWTIVTKDSSPAVQVEHTVLITESQPEILTQRN